MSTFDRIITSTPINKTAAVQLSTGIHWEPQKPQKETLRRWTEMPTDLLRPHPRASTFVDLTGQRRGRFTVVGYVGKLNPKKKALWLMRCTCGAFETRSAPAVTGGADTDACFECLYLEQVKRGNGVARRAA